MHPIDGREWFSGTASWHLVVTGSGPPRGLGDPLAHKVLPLYAFALSRDIGGCSPERESPIPSSAEVKRPLEGYPVHGRRMERHL